MVNKEISAIETEYKQKIIWKLKEELKLKNIYQVPVLQKIVVTTTSQYISSNKKSIDDFMEQLHLITNQKAIVTRMRKSISTFKVRTGQIIGCKVTLRSHNMYHFYQKLINFVFPRVRDFQGFSATKFDGQGNYSVGIAEQVSFFEIKFDKFKKLFGLNISFITSANDNYSGYLLLQKLGFPFNNKFKKKI